jgi:hypothetical protein
MARVCVPDTSVTVRSAAGQEIQPFTRRITVLPGRFALLANPGDASLTASWVPWIGKLGLDTAYILY